MALDPLELVIIRVIFLVVLLMGPKKIPEIAKALGQARKEFSGGSKEGVAPPTASVSASQPIPTQDPLIDTAHQLGISTEGKSRNQITGETVTMAGVYS
jgi:sec-independent protein translocase protein TatA